MKNNIFKVITAICLTAGILSFSNDDTVYAYPDYSDSEYWTNLCSSGKQLEQADYEACAAYRAYVESQSEDIQTKLSEIESERADIAANLETYGKQLDSYQADVDEINSQVSELAAQVSAKQAEIDEKNAEIEVKQAEIDQKQADIQEISDKMKTRITDSQSTMRINKYLEILMGSQSLEDFLRRMAGLNTITEYDQAATDEFVSAMSELSEAKKSLTEIKKELEDDEKQLTEKKDATEQKRNELLVAQYKIQVIKEEAEKQEASLINQGNNYAQNLSEIKSSVASLAYELNETNENTATVDESQEAAATNDDSDLADTSSQTTADQSAVDNNENTSNASNTFGTSGWAVPVPGSYRSAGTWNYGGGGVHLGYDFAVSQGTNIYAAADGVIVVSANGCTTGWLGNTCGYQYGGAMSGGNQIYMVVRVNGELYAVQYAHMLYGSLVGTGIVHAGDYIGKAGSTGNSSGPHCHIEVTYLGTGTISDYIANWNGDLSFGAGWANGRYGTYGRRCQDGVGAPCRIRPEEIWGYQRMNQQ